MIVFFRLLLLLTILWLWCFSLILIYTEAAVNILLFAHLFLHLNVKRAQGAGPQALRLSREAERCAHPPADRQGWNRLLTARLSIPSLLAPQVSTPRPRIPSSCGSLGTGAPGRSPSSRSHLVGTRPRRPGRGAPALAEAGIRLEKGGGDWRRRGRGGGLMSV